MKKLTPRQQEVLRAIERAISRQGAPPTIRELMEDLRLKSLRGVTIHLDALQEKGYIERSRQARGIRLLKRGKSDGALLQAPTPVPTLVPVFGRIAAGQPILAEQRVEEHIAVDPRWVPAPGCFAVRVHGDSMIGIGIENGDYVVIRPQPDAEPGEVVAVLVDGEATVKRFYRERGGRIRLQAENPRVEPIFLDPRQTPTRILGKVVGLYRKY